MNNFNYTINYKEGKCHIINSYLITKRCDMRYFIIENLKVEPFTKRSVNSYVREWRAHNLLYKLGLFVDRTKDTDLDINETRLRRFCYYFLSLLYF